VKRTALLSVYNKTGIVEFARRLKELGFDILASNDTARVLIQNQIPVTDVAIIVGPPFLGHGMVTLSRELHMALLAQDTPEDNAELARIGVPRIDLVYVNMYPLAEEIAKKDRTLESVVEKTDIGGPCMLRSAAKGRRIVLCIPAEMEMAIQHINKYGFMAGGILPESYISGLVAIAEQEVANYCGCSARFHQATAEYLRHSDIQSG